MGRLYMTEHFGHEGQEWAETLLSKSFDELLEHHAVRGQIVKP